MSPVRWLNECFDFLMEFERVFIEDCLVVVMPVVFAGEVLVDVQNEFVE